MTSASLINALRVLFLTGSKFIEPHALGYSCAMYCISHTVFCRDQHKCSSMQVVGIFFFFFGNGLCLLLCCGEIQPFFTIFHAFTLLQEHKHSTTLTGLIHQSVNTLVLKRNKMVKEERGHQVLECLMDFHTCKAMNGGTVRHVYTETFAMKRAAFSVSEFTHLNGGQSLRARPCENQTRAIAFIV